MAFPTPTNAQLLAPGSRSSHHALNTVISKHFTLLLCYVLTKAVSGPNCLSHFTILAVACHCDAGYTIECSEPSSVRCFTDPCANGRCPNYPSSVCLSNYCNAGKGKINGKGKPISEGPCTAIFVDSTTGKQVECKP